MLLPSNFGWRQVSFHVDVFGGSWRASPGEPPLEAPLETCCRPCHTAGEPKFGPAELWAAKTGPGVLYNKHYSGDCSGVYSAETRWGNTTGKYDGKTSMEPNLAPKQLDSNGIIFFSKQFFGLKHVLKNKSNVMAIVLNNPLKNVLDLVLCRNYG